MIFNEPYGMTQISKWRRLICKKEETTMYVHETSKVVRSSNVVGPVKDKDSKDDGWM